MKTQQLRNIRFSMTLRITFAAMAVFTLCFAARAAQVPAAAPGLDVPAHLSDFVLVKSEFVDDPTFGKDPFFPNSRRRYGNRPISTGPIEVVPATELRVNGISGSKNRPLAIINFRTFSLGETAELRVKGEVVKVRCIEITEKVVKVTVNGLPKELTVPETVKATPVIEKPKP